MKKNKYTWHDLGEDPKDLPEDGESVLVAYFGRYAVMTYQAYESHFIDPFGHRIWPEYVWCAWKRIEPFKPFEEMEV